jgi:predicted transcriptional regulator
MKSANTSDNNESKIISYIKENPGCYLRQIKNDLDISMGTIQYHLNKLEKDETVISNKSGLHKYFFLAGLFREHEKEIIRFLNQETPRNIIMFVIEQGQPTQTDIAKKVHISSPSINWNLQRLMNSKLILEKKDGKFKRYTLGPDIDSTTLIKLLKSYYPRIWDKWSDRLAEIFLSLSFNAETKGEDGL